MKSGWDFAKQVVWKGFSLTGERRADQAWLVYCLVRAAWQKHVRKRFTHEAEEEFVRHNVTYGQVCLDIGASIGDYTHLLSTLVGISGEIYAFEPNPSAYAVLSKRVAFFALRNVSCYRLALGAARGTVELAGARGRPASRYLAHIKASHEIDGKSVPVPMTTIDDFVEDCHMASLDFVKCDVEGAELMVFRGGQKTLREKRPVVLCEVEERWMRYGHTATEVFNLFHGLEYEAFVWQGARLVPVSGLTPSRNNYIFQPQERCRQSKIATNSHCL